MLFSPEWSIIGLIYFKSIKSYYKYDFVNIRQTQSAKIVH